MFDCFLNNVLIINIFVIFRTFGKYINGFDDIF